MQKVYIMVGVPGAGKTTFAKKLQNVSYLGTDDIRKELYGKELTLRGHGKVHRILHERMLQEFHMDTSLFQALKNNRRRQRHVPVFGILFFSLIKESPTTDEGFSKIIHVSM